MAYVEAKDPQVWIGVKLKSIDEDVTGNVVAYVEENDLFVCEWSDGKTTKDLLIDPDYDLK